MLKECKQYYTNLYAKFPTDPKEQNSLLENLKIKVKDEQNKTLTKAITKKEIHLAFQKWKKGKILV